MKNIYKNGIKRLLDIVFSVIFLIVLSSVFAVLAMLVATKLGRPVIFMQQRPGKNEKLFTMYKFRTMNNKCDETGKLLADAERLTQFGNSLRRSSLDELPELVNILKGDMSFVGPRPLLVRYLSRYNKTQARRHEVRPGLTGYAQVNGRNAIGWEEKFEYDVEYVDHISFALDLKILFSTFRSLYKKEGISQQGRATMDEFMGPTEED